MVSHPFQLFVLFHGIKHGQFLFATNVEIFSNEGRFIPLFFVLAGPSRRSRRVHCPLSPRALSLVSPRLCRFHCCRSFVALFYFTVRLMDKLRALAINTKFDILISSPFSTLEIYGLFFPIILAKSF